MRRIATMLRRPAGSGTIEAVTAGPEGAAAAVPSHAPPGVVADYLTLVKPRIMLLLLVTTYGAMAWAEGGLPPLGLTIATLGGMALASGGASAFNHVYDRDIDALMTRTRLRPVADGRVSPLAGSVYATVLLVASVVVLAVFANWLAALLALAGALFYVVIYTVLLKRRTPQNIVIGGAAGAVPPLVGWAAVTGGVDFEPVVMFAIVFLWTPPHFWALAMMTREDYRRAGVPMLPVVASTHSTTVQILVYTVLLALSTLVPVMLGLLGVVYLVAAVILGARFVQLAVRLMRSASIPAARATFLYSLAYLALLFAAMGLDRAVERL
jgi:protoheme IX farnesyltransferase